MADTHTHIETQCTYIQYECSVTQVSSALLSLVRFVLKGFAKDGRDLTDKETKAFLAAADKDGDGKIGVDGKHQHQIPLEGVSKDHTHIKTEAEIKSHTYTRT